MIKAKNSIPCITLLGNSARNAVIVLREVKRVLSTLRGWYYVSISPPPPTPLPGLVVVVVLSGSLMLPLSSMYL